MSKNSLVKLKNGLTVVLQRDMRVSSVCVGVGVRAGSCYETKETAGLAHFLEHMLFEGTALYPTAKELAEQIETVGGYSGAYTNREHVFYSAKVLSPHIEKALQYLSQVVFQPVLLPEAIEKEKGIVAEELGRTMDNPEHAIWEKWMKWVWGADQPLGRSILGDMESVKKITTSKLKKYLQNLYVPQNMVLTIVGNFSLSEVKRYIQKYFGVRMNGKTSVAQKSVSPKHGFHITASRSEVQQVQLLCGYVTGVSHSHKDRFAMRLLSEILTGGVSARIFHKLIYDLGVAYSVGSYEMELKDTGIFFISGGFAKENIERAVQSIFDELKKLRVAEIPIGELVSAKERSVAKLYFSAEKPDNLADLYVSQFMTEGHIMTIEELSAQINAVSMGDIKRIANHYFTRSNMYIMLHGQVEQHQTRSMANMIDTNFENLG